MLELLCYASVAMLPKLLVITTLAVSVPATASILPPQYQATQQQLTTSCGADRAQVMAALSYDADIHKQWLDDIKDNPKDAAKAGDVHWHRYWISVYQRAITLLAKDCS